MQKGRCDMGKTAVEKNRHKLPKDLTGMRFGRLVALYRVDMDVCEGDINKKNQ